MLASLRPTIRLLFVISIAVFASGLLVVAAYLMLREEPSEPEGRIAFAAGGSIYVVNADGGSFIRVVEGERKDGLWASAPAFSPEGRRIAFARDFDIWILDVAHDTFEHLDVAQYEPSPGASNWSVGVTNVSWSPDGEELLFGTARIGGSGLGHVERIRADGRDRARLFTWSAGFILPWWLLDGHIAFAGNGDEIALLDPDVANAGQKDVFQNPDGEAFSRIEVEAAGWPGVIDTDGSEWLVGSFFEEAPFSYGEAAG